jgi:cell division protein FtsB
MFKTLGIPQFIIIIIVAVAFILSWDFGRRIFETVQLVQAAQAAEQELQQVKSANTQLRQLKRDVTTDEWVVKKARVDLHYARENETLFIPAATPAPPGMPAPQVVPAPPARTFWDDVLEALFGPPE